MLALTRHNHQREQSSRNDVLRCALTGGNPDSNTLISDMTTVICLDDYHSLDRGGRKRESVTALDPKAQNFDLMYEQIKDLKDGKTVAKPIYNHVSGLLDPPEDTSAAKVCLYCMAHSCIKTALPLMSISTVMVLSVFDACLCSAILVGK
jgi:uridine kinase